ncbi:MAG: carbon-nitrogen hydrolase family protein [Chloroflexi bacterium]|nr:carbon-nitrogen hydrolase family protein [Chloroflexota bacterium]
MERILTVAAAQVGPTTDDKAATVERLAALLDAAGERGVQMLCYPELCLMPFFPARLVRDNDAFFDELPGPLVEPLLIRVRRYRIALVLPYGERESDAHYNSALVFDERGEVIGKYRKVHLPAYFPSSLPGGTGSFERLYFAPGNLGFPVFEVMGVRVGVQICYDRLFPEGSRALALKGAEVVFYPNNLAAYGQPYRWSVWERLLCVRAYENGFFGVAPNKAGLEGARDNIGQSLVVGPLEGGEVLAKAEGDGDELVVANIDLAQVAEARKRLPFWRDRRPDQYGDLVR